MHADDLTYGIEIECYIPARLLHDEVVVLGRHDDRGEPVRIEDLPPGWRAKGDGSLSSPPPNYIGVEFVSPVLQGADGLRQIREVCSQMKEWQAKVNRTCGFHVHVGWTFGMPQLKKLTSLVSNFQKALYASTGTVSRERGEYSAPIKAQFKELQWNASSYNRLGEPAMRRYHMINLSNLALNVERKRTVEFRLFSGTLNFGKMCAYVRVSLGLTQKAVSMKKCPSWDYKFETHLSKEQQAAGMFVPARPADQYGTSDLRRMFAALGWAKGKSKVTFGEMRETAIDLPTLEASGKVLMRMASKYDRQAIGVSEVEPQDDDDQF